MGPDVQREGWKATLQARSLRLHGYLRLSAAHGNVAQNLAEVAKLMSGVTSCVTEREVGSADPLSPQ